MKTFLRRIVPFALAILLTASFAWAQENYEMKPLGVTRSDISNFCKNIDKINEALDEYDVDESDIMTEAMAYAEYEELENILAKYGISGPARVLKVSAIAVGYSTEKFRQEMDKDPEAAALMKQMGLAPYAMLEAMVHPDDLAVIKVNMDVLDNAFAETDSDDERDTRSKKQNNDKKKESKSKKSNFTPDEDDIENAIKSRLKDKFGF